MSLKLYFAPGACSFVPHSLLETAGTDFEPLMVKLHKGERQWYVYKKDALHPGATDGPEASGELMKVTSGK